MTVRSILPSHAIGVLCIAAATGTLMAGAASAQHAEPPSDPPSCGEIRLEAGAAQAEDAAGAREAWHPALRRAVECLSRAGDRACIEVRGQYAERGADDRTGGRRARDRSGAVVSELVDALGVEQTRVRERPPGTKATFGGATLHVINDCLPAPVAEPQASAREHGPFSVDGRLGLGLFLTSPEDAFTADLRAGFGWGEDRFYARVFASLGTADRLEQRVAWEWGLAGGLRPLRWLRVGGRFTHRFGTFETFDTWLVQSWLLGVESEQRILEGDRVSVWIGEHISPLGLRKQRATVQNATVIDTADRVDYAFVAGVSIIVRGHLRAGRGLVGSPPTE